MPFVVLLFGSDVLGEEKEALWSSLKKKFDDRSEWLRSIDEFNAKSKRRERKIFFLFKIPSDFHSRKFHMQKNCKNFFLVHKKIAKKE